MENLPPLASGPTEGVERPQPEDFEGLWRRYGKLVFALCLRMTRNEAEAQDLMQEAFVRLFQKLDTFRGESVGNSKSRLHRARRRLRKLLAQCSPRRARAGRLPAGEVQAARRAMPGGAWVAA